MGFFEDLIASLSNIANSGFASGTMAYDPVTDPKIAPSIGSPESYSPEDAARISALAKERISGRLSDEQSALEQQKSSEEKRQKLLEAAGRKNQQLEFMSGTVPLVEDYDKRIAIGGDSKGGSAEDIMFRIRAEARAKGRNGSLRGGQPTEEDYYAAAKGPRWSSGALTTAADSPEIRQRLSERDAWVAEQPMRDMEFALTRGQQQMRPEQAATARELLPQMQQQSTLRRQQALQEKLVGKLADGSGKIPFEKAMQLEAAGLNIPYGARGMSPEQFDSKISDIIQGASVDLNRAIEAQSMGAPPEAITAIAGFSKFIEQRARQLKSLVDQGQMSRDEADALLQQIIMTEAQSTNAIKASQLLGFGQQQQPVGE